MVVMPAGFLVGRFPPKPTEPKRPKPCSYIKILCRMLDKLAEVEAGVSKAVYGFFRHSEGDTVPD